MMRITDDDCPLGGTHYMVYHEDTSVDSHGLDAGPYERYTEAWLECACGERVELNERAELQSAG